MHLKNKTSRRSVITITVFIICIIAIALLLLISIVRKFSYIFLAAEGVVLICLIFLLTSTLISRRKIIEHNKELARSPYGKVDKKEIDKIFDMIDKEEQRRGRTMAWAAPAKSEEKKEEVKAEEKSAEEPKAESAEEDEDALPIIFPDKDEYEGDKKAFTPISEERAAARKEEKEKEKEAQQQDTQAEEKESSADEIADLVAAASLGGAVGEITQEASESADAAAEQKLRGKGGKGGKNMDNRPKKRQPVYYDQYGRPIAAPVRQAPAQPVGYDQYGRPIFAQRPPQKKPRPIGFDQNGRPIYPPQQRKPRVPVGYDQYGRPIFAPAQPVAGARQRPAGARPPQGQRRRPAPAAGAVVPGAEQAAAPAVPQIPTEPMAASAADALAALEANVATTGNTYYDEDYIPVVVHVEEDFNYTDDRYTPRVRAGITQDAPPSVTGVMGTVAAAGAVGVAAAAASNYADEYNSSGSGTYRPDYAGEDIPVVVPMFEDMEVDYSSNRGFTPMSDPFAQKSYAPPVYTPEPVRTEQPLAPTPIYQETEYNASSKADYKRDEDEERFVYVPHFDDDDPIPEPTPQAPAIPHWKLAKMKRRKVTRRSRRGMLFKLKADKFSEYTAALKA